MNMPVNSASDVIEESNKDDIEQYLTFLLGQELFAIGILHIKEIIEYGQITSVPMMPEFVRGVINLRGRVVPVVDLLPRFGRESTTPGKRTGIVIVEVNHKDDQQVIGIVVDSVSEVLPLTTKDIEPPPSFGAKLRPDFIEGMGKIAEDFVIILNVDHVLSIEELATLSKNSEI